MNDILSFLGYQIEERAPETTWRETEWSRRLREEEEKTGAARKSKIGTGDRAEKIRTYNYPQNRVTDHRIGFTSMNLDRIMTGDLGVIIEALINENQRLELEKHEL